jgi:hypothetical protein
VAETASAIEGAPSQSPSFVKLLPLFPLTVYLIGTSTYSISDFDALVAMRALTSRSHAESDAYDPSVS